jgi:Gas vesicle protein
VSIERDTAATSVIDVLDRVLDKGIVIDAWVRVSIGGIDLITVEARIVVASFDTYLRYANVLAENSLATTTVKQVTDRGMQVHVTHHLPSSYARRAASPFSSATVPLTRSLARVRRRGNAPRRVSRSRRD